MVVQVFVYDQQWLLVGACNPLLIKYIYYYFDSITRSGTYVLLKPFLSLLYFLPAMLGGFI